MSDKIKILLTIILFVSIIEASSQTPVLVFFDDFSNPTTTESKFSFYDPNNTRGTITAHTVINNYLELRMDVTDANSWAVVKHDFASDSKIIIVCDLYYQAGNSWNYYMPQINFAEYSTATYKVTGSIIQAKMQTDHYTPDNPCGDNIHPSLTNYLSTLNQNSCVQNFRLINSFASATSASFYNRWLNGAIITLDKTTGYVSVDIEGDGLIDMDGFVPSSLIKKVNTVSFSPYGWFTGHLMRIRNLKIYAVNGKTFSTINKSICEGQNYLGYTTSGTYIDTLLNHAGFDSIRTLNLNVIPKTYSTINSTICEGQNYLGYTLSGAYVDTLVNNEGCDSIRTLNLNVIPKTYSSINSTICEGQNYLGYSVNGTYVDTLVNKAGCDSIRTLSLTVNPKPIVFAGKDTSLIAGNSIIIIGSSVSSNIISLQWTPNYAIDNITLLNPTVNPLNTTVYALTATNSLGCTTSDSVKVTVIPRYNVLVPSAFTPNSDGKNDVFKPTFFYVPITYKMSVYNRYGQLVFETDDYTKGWNGKINQVLQNSGTYVWMIVYSLQNNIKEAKQGTVSLIKLIK